METIGTEVETQHGRGTIVSIDTDTYSVPIFTVQLDSDTSIAITRGASISLGVLCPDPGL